MSPRAPAAAFIEVLSARMSGRRPSAVGQPFQGMRLADLMASRMGLSTRDPNEILHRTAMGTSDFPFLLEAAANKVLLESFRTAPQIYRLVAERRDMADFKDHSFLRASDFPALLPLGEGGQIRFGALSETREKLALKTKARAVSLTRQMIINDDLGAFGDMVRGAARSAANTEERMFIELLALNSGGGPTMSDGQPMFSTAHGNRATTPTALDKDNLAKGRAAMRAQKNLDSEVLDISPSLIMAGVERETEAEALITAIQPNSTANVNPFAGKLSAVASGRLPPSAWYLFADPQRDGANFVYGYLSGQDGPAVRVDRPFNYDGVSFGVVHDFAVGGVDYRFGYLNA